MRDAHGFQFLDHVPVLKEWPPHLVLLGGVVLFLSIAFLFARRPLTMALSDSEKGLWLPQRIFRWFHVFEILGEQFYQVAQSVLGAQGARRYFPMVAALFFFILFSNLLGLVPGLTPFTDNINVTAALGVFVFFYYHWVGIKAHGLAYLKHFLGPVLWLAPLLLVIELASHLFRPLSLALRLRANILGDHIVLGIFSDLVPYFLPVLFYGLGVFVSLMQAFVFCLMTMVYISLSTSHDDSSGSH